MKLNLIILGLLCVVKNGAMSSDIKSSLTFVIDDTYSMTDDIHEVKIGAKVIFDTVLNSNNSQIEDYVLVTINDPEFKVRKKTNDAGVFQAALKDLDVDRTVEGNYDCAERSMSGVELALQNSREGSTLYVFTDAAAKDYEKYSQVEELSQKMGCQIVFVLTGVCEEGRTDAAYLVYHQLAKATNGQVFHLEKYEIGKILTYVEYNIENRKQILMSKNFRGGKETFDITVDADTKELVIAVSGKSPSVSVTDSRGTEWPTTSMTMLDEVAVVKVIGFKPDLYKVEVGGKGDTRVVVSGSTSVHFQHGFSIATPSTIADTVRRPVPGEESYLSIRLSSDGRDVELRSVQLLDMNDTVILEKPLNLVDETEQFYTTSEQIIPPNQMFKVAIKAYDVDTETFLTRISLTPVKPQEVRKGVKHKAPGVTCKTQVTASYGKPLQMKCKISGYPKPDVTWESDDKSAQFTHFELIMELPYDYISVLNINEMKNNATYSCKARNSAGNDQKSIVVHTKMVNYFKTLAIPNDTTIEYQKSGHVPCKVEAYPPATITWYKNGIPVTNNDANIELTANASVLSIRSMEPYLVNYYKCEARNSVGKRTFNFRINISGVEAPEINKTNSEPIRVIENSGADIRCQLIKGTPTPTIRWLYNEIGTSEFEEIFETSNTLHFDKVVAKNAGTYRCIAENVVEGYSYDFQDYTLIVEYKPSIGKQELYMTKDQGTTVALKCPADGKPTPNILWKFNGATIRSIGRHSISTDGTLAFSATSLDSGQYVCEARNSHGVDKININLDVTEPVEIESPTESLIKRLEGLPLNLPCRAEGSPKPQITWFYHSSDNFTTKEFKPSDATGRLKFDSVLQSQSGQYTCVATNSKNSKNITYEVLVLGPPSIQYTAKEFLGIVGDKQLQIPCRTTGNPKPTIIWSIKGYQIKSGPKLFNIGEDGTLTIKNIDGYSEGIYKCKAYNYYGESEEAFIVIVKDSSGVKPSFTYESDKNIAFVSGKKAVMDCTASGEPAPKVIWYHDDKELSLNDYKYEFQMSNDNEKGNYTCVVSNKHGTVKQNFVVSSFECVLDVDNGIFSDASKPQILLSYDMPTHIKTIGGIMYIPQHESIKFVCPSNFNTIPANEITLTCENEQQFVDKSSGMRYLYSDLRCTDNSRPVVKRTGKRCTNGNSEMLQIGFETRGIFQEVYEVCQDRTSNNTIYTKFNMQPPLSKFTPNNNTEWFSGSSEDVLGLYDCNNQIGRISTILKKEFHRDGCCFAIRMLVNPLDVAPGLPQATTYSPLNFAPHWGTCNSKNWEEVERRIRNLVSSSKRQLQVWSGTAEDLQLPDARSKKKNIVLHNSGKSIQVPRFFWKVIQDSYTASSLVVVQVNVPDLKLKEARKYMLCNDVCKQAVWMRSGRWRKVNYGYTYCCSLAEFKRVFHYDDMFPNYHRLLLDV